MPCPKVNLETSSTSKDIHAGVQRQGDHPCAIGSRFLDRYVTRYWDGPRVWIRIPRTAPLLSCTHKEMGFSWSGRDKAGALVNACLSAPKLLSFQSHTPKSPTQIPLGPHKEDLLLIQIGISIFNKTQPYLTKEYSCYFVECFHI